MALDVIVQVLLVLVSLRIVVCVNDIKWKKCMKLNVRMIGLVLAGFAPWGMLLYRWKEATWQTPYTVAFVFGIFLMLISIPAEFTSLWRNNRHAS